MHASPRPHRFTAPLALSALCVLALSLAACETTRNLVPDQPPTVTLTSGPIDTASTPHSWIVDISWVGSDPDGRIDHYEYAIDPPSAKQARLAPAETAWVSTKETHIVAHFRASHPDSLGFGATASEHHIFVLRAIDDRHVASPDVVRAFYAYTVAPDVRITEPVPSRLIATQVGPPFRLSWVGNDPDGAGTTQPAAYRLRLLQLDGIENQTFVADPDSLFELGIATNWADWRTVGGDTTTMTVGPTGFAAGSSWMIAVLAVDAAGATTPYLSLDRNLLMFQVLPTGGPSVHVFSTAWDYTSPPSSFAFTPAMEVPSGHPLTFQFEGVASGGRTITGTRWAINNTNPNDQTPRSNEDTDFAHWSREHLGVVTATFTLSPGQNLLDIQTFDDFGGSSVLNVRLTAFEATLDHDLLVVNDTRLEVDKFSPGSGGTPNPYTQPWPGRAEMDTFLFARGGVPWRGTISPTTGALSPSGLLAGYAFDTLGTRLGFENPAQGVPLSTLARYRHVLWLVDARGSQFGPGLDPSVFPPTALRAMSAPGVTSTLEAYVQLGGQVWLAGGGAAYASLVNFDMRSNNQGVITVFSAAAGELAPGRLMYDAAHIRSAIGVLKGDVNMTRSPAAIGSWSGHGPDGTLSAPDYTHAPPAMRRRDPGTDPLPPTRLASQASLYYPSSFAAGLVLEPNVIREDFSPDPNVERIESALDTVYDASGPTIPIPAAPVMTYYHGRDNAPFVYTGFELWDWTRADCQGLVDFVLGDIWKLSKSAGARARPAATSMSRVPPASTPRMPVRLDPRRMRP